MSVGALIREAVDFRLHAVRVDLGARRLGVNDRIHAATALGHEIDTIVSADTTFDEMPAITRVDPPSDAERSRLLTS